MTYTKLIEQLRVYSNEGAQTDVARITQREAAYAIEALQAENGRLKRDIESQKTAFNAVADALNKAAPERDALQAKLDALQTQEPAGHFLSNYGEEGLWLCCKAEIKGMTEPLYSAPKALEPLTDEQIHDLSVAFRGGADWSEEDFETAELFARAIEAAHGITKGTPT